MVLDDVVHLGVQWVGVLVDPATQGCGGWLVEHGGEHRDHYSHDE
jgi:hypothetical protein